MSVTKASDVGRFPHGRVPRELRERQLLELAERLFAERGYHGAAMDELARRAGVSKPVIYGFFGSKESLYAACVERGARALAEQVAGAVRGEEDPRSRLRSGSAAFFRFIHEQREAWAILFEEPETDGAGAFVQDAARIRERQSALMAGLLAESAAEGGTHVEPVRVEATAHALAGAYEFLARWWRRYPDLSPETLTDWFLDLTWPGLERLLERGRTGAPPSGPVPAEGKGEARQG